MLNQVITLHQLMTEPLIVPDKHVLRSVLAQGKFGKTRVWNSHEIIWSWKLGDTDSRAFTPMFFDLIVLGDPKVIAVHLVTDSAFFGGVFEAPISMTLANGLIWVQEWMQPSEQGSRYVVAPNSIRMKRASPNTDGEPSASWKSRRRPTVNTTSGSPITAPRIAATTPGWLSSIRPLLSLAVFVNTHSDPDNSLNEPSSAMRKPIMLAFM